MSDLDLASFAIAGDQTPAPIRQRRGKQKWLYEPLRPDLLSAGTVLAWDQTLGKAGWCLLGVLEAGATVLAAGVCKTDGGQKGWGEALLRGDEQDEMIEAVFAEHGAVADFVAHEAPTEGKPKFGDSRSSALAARGVRSAARRAGLPIVMVPAQRAKLLVTGNAQAAKAQIRQTILAMNWLEGRVLLRTEDMRDGAVIGLASKHLHLEDK